MQEETGVCLGNVDPRMTMRLWRYQAGRWMNRSGAQGRGMGQKHK